VKATACGSMIDTAGSTSKCAELFGSWRVKPAQCCRRLSVTYRMREVETLEGGIADMAGTWPCLSQVAVDLTEIGLSLNDRYLRTLADP
jgi:hypothetical protein